ncbi:cyclase family protein [Burkholderia plantarii]|uniref:cyclase family protein n=1 Tax=Burkholderia plantarii TaxID=41899 RepID=UPI0018DE1D74|nr:cyclase family protein [Burkholderia plantarii]MBI0326449.1 cyclase family protein [Burkholderia plantarii]
MGDERVSTRFKKRPEGSNWGDFGADDQLGRLNLLTPRKVREGAAEVREGKSFCLSLPLDLPGGSKWNPRRRPPTLLPVLRNNRSNIGYELRQDDAPYLTDVLCDHRVTLDTQYSTQWDALSQVGSLYDLDGDGNRRSCFYNGYAAERDMFGPLVREPDAHGMLPPAPTRALGIEHMAATGVQGRGVLIDLEAHFGRERRRIGYQDLMQVMDRDRIVVEPGDIVLFHTGFAQMLVEMNGDPDVERLEHACAELDGRDEALLRWIDEAQIAAIAADNHAVEAYPAGKLDEPHYPTLPLHELCLFKLGIHLGEFWYLTPLARWLRDNARSRFLLTAPPLRLTGAVASPVTPVATV